MATLMRSSRSVIWPMCVALCMTMWATARSQETIPTSQPPKDIMQPTELGLRLTPGMASALGDLLGKEWLGGQYDLDADAQQQAGDLFARRLLTLAHKNQQLGQAFLEFACEDLMRHKGEFTPETGQRWAQHIGPLLPEVKAFTLTVIDDFRTLVPADKQARYARDTIMASMYFDALAKKMTRWKQGDVREGENPFDADEEMDKTDDDPNAVEAQHERQRERAEQFATRRVDRASTGRWRDYVDQAGKAYGFDETQQASAESILTEMQQRADAVMTDTWRAKANANRAQVWVAWRTADSRNEPWMWSLEHEWAKLVEPIQSMTHELQSRLDRLPTQRQRQTATADFVEELDNAGLTQ